MALPASGPISGSQIGTELGIVSGPYSLRNMSASASFSSPDAMSEFYGYSGEVYVEIRACFPSTATCSSSGTATSKSYILGTNTPINIDGGPFFTVVIIGGWYGDLGGYQEFALDLSQGTSCTSTSYATYSDVSCGGENYSYDGVTLLTYDSFIDGGNQIYSVGSTSVGSCSC